MKTLALALLIVLSAGCAALNTSKYGDCMLPKDLWTLPYYPVQAVVCTAVYAATGPRDRQHAPPPADPAPPLPAPLAEHPPITATNGAALTDCALIHGVELPDGRVVPADARPGCFQPLHD